MAQKIRVTNPFSVTSYLGPEYFCDRQTESKDLRDALYNSRNITLISPRKIGKTGLVQHVFQSISPKEAYCFYVDIYDTTNLTTFTKTLAESVLSRQLASFTARAWEEVSRFFASLRPTITTDPLTGMPQCSVDIKPQNEEISLAQVFAYMEKANLPCYVAIDEFQTVADYKDCKMEALLRKYIQKLTNVHFIFAGSKKHVMMQMFTAPNRPFFQSTQMLYIDCIEEDAYYEFASRHLAANKQNISLDVFHELYTILSGHTWYMQYMLNRLYQDSAKDITREVAFNILRTILQENAPSYQTYCRLITSKQKEILSAVAKEGRVKSYNSTDFLRKYSLGAASTVTTAVHALVDKELLYEENNEYSVYDRFFGLWLKESY